MLIPKVSNERCLTSRNASCSVLTSITNGKACHPSSGGFSLSLSFFFFEGFSCLGVLSRVYSVIPSRTIPSCKQRWRTSDVPGSQFPYLIKSFTLEGTRNIDFVCLKEAFIKCMMRELYGVSMGLAKILGFILGTSLLFSIRSPSLVSLTF